MTDTVLITTVDDQSLVIQYEPKWVTAVDVQSFQPDMMTKNITLAEVQSAQHDIMVKDVTVVEMQVLASVEEIPVVYSKRRHVTFF